jgi:hypothetical protein
VYDVGLVRSLCHLIAAEQDSREIEALLHLLHAVIYESDDEVRLHLKFLRKKKYASALNKERSENALKR